MTTPTWTEIHAAGMAAMHAILTTGQSVTADGRTLTMADIQKVQESIDYAARQIARQNRGGMARLVSVVPSA